MGAYHGQGLDGEDELALAGAGEQEARVRQRVLLPQGANEIGASGKRAAVAHKVALKVDVQQAAEQEPASGGARSRRQRWVEHRQQPPGQSQHYQTEAAQQGRECRERDRGGCVGGQVQRRGVIWVRHGRRRCVPSRAP